MTHVFHPAPYWDKAVATLHAADPIMAQLIDQYDCPLQSRNDPFFTLARAIAGQQVSVISADAVWARLEQCLHMRTQNVTPQAIASLSTDDIRACGFTRQKTAYLHNIAHFFLSEDIKDMHHWDNMDDAAVTAHITQIKGIGRWSADMFLLFCLMRQDIFPLDDIGLQRALLLHYNTDYPPKPFPRDWALELSHQWAPYRSVALMYLWRSIDPGDVGY